MARGSRIDAALQHRSAPRGVEIVILVVLLLNYLTDPLIATGVAAIALTHWITTNRFAVPRLGLRLTAIPVGLVVLGIVMGIDRPAYDIGKDAWYFLVPGFGVMFGVVAARAAVTPRRLLTGFLVAGTLLSIIFLAGFAADPAILRNTDVDAIRGETGAGYFPTVFALLILLIFRQKPTAGQTSAFAPVAAAAWVVNGLALVLSFSRTMWFIFLIGLIVQQGIVSLRRAIVLMVAVGIGLTLVLAYLSGSGSEGELVLSMLGKVTRSIEEIIPSAQDSESEVNINWRGYETLMGLQTYFSGSLPQLIFGQGFGALVDVGFSITLGEGEFRYIPILHNGYVYLLVKVGALGLLGYLVWLYKIFSIARAYPGSKPTFAGQASRLVQILVLVILFTTFVVSGIFNKHHALPLTMLVGVALMFATGRSRAATGGAVAPSTPNANATI